MHSKYVLNSTLKHSTNLVELPYNKNSANEYLENVLAVLIPFNDKDLNILKNKSIYNYDNGDFTIFKNEEIFNTVLDDITANKHENIFGFARYITHSGSTRLIAKYTYQCTDIDIRSKTYTEILKTVKFLIKNEHFSPLEHASVTLQLRLPIFCARQLMRHRTGKYTELSGRYRKSDINIKDFPIQQSSAELSNEAILLYEKIQEEIYFDAVTKYIKLTEAGIPKEDARVILPLDLMSEYYFTIDLRNFLNLLKLRLSKHTQHQTRKYAEAMYFIVAEFFFDIINEYLNGIPESSKSKYPIFKYLNKE